MPADQTIFSDAMKKASNAAWDRQWPAAIEQYRRALAEFPDDTVAHGGLALALEQSGQLDEALHEYKAWSKLQPGDAVPLNRTGALCEHLGKPTEAASAYLAAADVCRNSKQLNLAIEALRHAVALDPDRAQTHERLAAALKEAGQNTAAAQELIALARIGHRRGDAVLARKVAEDALALDADNNQAKSLLVELGGAPRPSVTGEGSPVEQAQRSSLSRLAQAVFEDGSTGTAGQAEADIKPDTSDVDALTARAIDAQSQGRLLEAIQSYEQIVKAGTGRNEVFFNLGTLYLSVQRYPEAVEMLGRTVADPQFSLPSLMALGNAYQVMGQVDAAQDSYLQAMRILDLSAVGRNEVDQVIGLYQSVADGYRGRGDTRDAESFMNSLVDFLNSKGWQDKVQQVRDHMQAVAEAGSSVELAEILETNDSGQVIEALRLSQQHLKNGLVNSASDEALRAIEIAPEYLPAHLQLAEILEASGRFGEAREKYEMLAETAFARGDLPKAISFSRHSLAINPGDLDRRGKLIDLLVRQGQLEEALREFATQGDAIDKTGEHRRAVETYIEGLQLADRVDPKSTAAALLRSRLADSYVRARDWRNAISVLEQTVELAPRDERSRFLLADLFFRVRQRENGERHLDELLQGCGKNSARARAILSALAKNLPKEVGVNIRLARSLAGAGEMVRAVELLDRLGDEMLANGERDQAVLIIQEIIALDPPQAQDYRRLLAELEQKRANDVT